ncbi:polar amino acid transport system permease protein [Mesorhizobium soli]|uniref:amino acid ABC transporter permease n=1 Tax=Pseudaminobacter soli (ex Li et al. 2025) TaxID=1295366 RepID=UPI002475D175|nr:amino acid ABC transporter permease [Mesorhizobium soli]MDH6234843.1 polar amino acid transport system permease protein [Mesorhizobium soli]
MGFDIDFALSTVPAILGAIGMTLLVALASCLGAATFGFCLEILRRPGGILGLVVRFLIDFIRATPVLVWLYCLYFILPFYGLRLSALTVGITGLSLYYSGYLAEVFKAGIDAIAKGQQEAARALGLGRLDSIIFVIAPQMLRNIAAPMGNYFVSILKATPYLAVLAVPEMLGQAFDIASETYRYAEPLTVAGLIFLALALAIAQAVKWLERRLSAPTSR